MNEPDFYDLEPREEPRRSGLRIALYLGLVLLLITGLLWSAFSSVTWLLERSRAQMEAATAVPLIPTIAAAPTTVIPTPDPAFAVNRIAFVNDDGQVETIAPDGSDRRVISDESAAFIFPTWSPTGEYVAAISGSTLYRLADAPDLDVQTLYASRSQNPFYLYWSPDGRFVSFLTNHPRGVGLYLAPVDGREEARLLELGSPFYWDWTADSSQILIHTGFGAGTARLSLLDVASGRGGPNAAVPGSFQAPDISRDGRYWAYAELDENGSSWLVAAEAATGAVERQRHAGLVAFSWSPAAEQLAFISGSERQLNFAGPLRLLDMTTGETSLLGQELVVAFFWSPDGRYLAAITTDERPGGVIAEGNGRRRLSKPTQQHPAITLSLFVIDVAAGEKRYLTEFEPTLTFITQFLPYFDQYALSHRLWSPASDALVLPAREDDADHILIVPINGDPPRQLATGDMPFWSQY